MEDNSITKEYRDIFAADALKELLPYQADHLRREFGNFLALNKASRSCCFNTCPKCGEQVDHFKRGGYTYTRRKMVQTFVGKSF